MSETAPERTPPARSSRGGKLGLFTERIGPLPMWVWVAIIAVLIIGWRLYSNKKQASSSAAATSSSTPADQVPEFVNQTYTTVTPPASTPPQANPQPAPTPSSPAPKGQTLVRTWTSLGGSTYAQVAQRLLGDSNTAGLKPANAAAQKWVATVYAKNHNAKMPKGLTFTYTEGTVAPKSA